VAITDHVILVDSSLKEAVAEDAENSVRQKLKKLG
jgi:hypothetical protein